MNEEQFALPVQISPEMHGLLQKRREADVETLNDMQQSAFILCKETDGCGVPVDPAARQSYLMLTEAVYTLQFRIYCWDELLAEPERNAGIYDSSVVLRRFVSRAEQILQDHLCVICDAVPFLLYTHLPPNRLSFHLLCLTELLLRDLPQANQLMLHAASDGTMLRVELSAGYDPAHSLVPLRFRGAEHEPAILRQLTDRFCEQYGIRLIRKHTAQQQIGVLEIPTVQTLTPALAVSSDRDKGMQSRQLFYAAFSRITPVMSILADQAEFL